MLIGFVGLGNMGGGLARNLIRAGKEVLVYNRSRPAVEKTLAVGISGKAAESIDEMAAVDVLFTCLPLPTDLEQVMLGEDGLLGRMKRGSTYIDVSTIDPRSARKMAAAAAEKGIQFLECPLGKGPAAAETAEEPIFVGGDRNVFEQMKEILAIVGSPLYYVGDVEASSAFKLISNLVGMTNLAAMAEGMRLGEKAGIDKKTLVELLEDTGANSFQLNVRAPWIAAGDFENRFGAGLALKDMALGCEMADDWGLDPKLMKQTLDYFEETRAEGYSGEDCNAVYKVIK